MSKTLHLPMMEKWHQMITAGIKKQDYRAIKPFWIKRLFYKEYTLERIASNQVKIGDYYYTPKEYEKVSSDNGYAKNKPVTVLEYLGVTIGPAVPEWSDNWPGECFVIKLGEILSITK